MQSPPVQPIRSITSGTGSVRTMWEEATVSRLRSGPRPALGGAADREHGARGADRAAVGASPRPRRRPRGSERTGEDS